MLVACACVLLRAAPAAIADGGGGALPQAMGMLLEALRGGSEGLRRMAAAALDAIGGEARLAPALLSGSPPLLQHLLTELAPALGAAPLPEAQLLALFSALAGCVASASAALAAPLDAPLAALLAHPDARWAAAVSVLGLGGGGAATGLDPDAAKELALLLKLYAATYSSLGPAGGAAAATALVSREAALLDVVGRAGAQLEASVGAAAAAGYAHALATREVRAVRGARDAASRCSARRRRARRAARVRGGGARRPCADRAGCRARRPSRRRCFRRPSSTPSATSLRCCRGSGSLRPLAHRASRARRRAGGRR